jgi:DNA-binding transcriptional ArsR family regulator
MRPDVCIVPLEAVESILVDDASLRVLCLLASNTMPRGMIDWFYDLQMRLPYESRVLEVALARLELAGFLVKRFDGTFEVCLNRPDGWKMPESPPVMPGEEADAIPATVVAEVERPKHSVPRRSGISIAVRYRILKRDNFKCVYCGRNASDVALEIDHYTPVSAGGSNDDTNLRSACRDCNAGKGATIP